MAYHREPPAVEAFLINVFTAFSPVFVEHRSKSEEASLTPVVLPLSATVISDVENWLINDCSGGWRWRGIIASPAGVIMTFYFANKSDALLFKLTFSSAL